MLESTDCSRTRVSIVVPALNEGQQLRATIDSLLATVPADTEILVVDDASEDGCADFLAGSGERVRLVRSDRLGVARARNWGASQTTGDVIVFADAHLVLPRDWLPALLEPLERPNVAATAPAIYDTSDATRQGFGITLSGPELDGKWLRRRGDEAAAVPILPGCCLAMRRDAFLSTGGFEDGLMSRGGVDNELGIRLWLLGWELMVVPRVSVGHIFRKFSPYPVLWSTYLYNRIRTARLHLKASRAAKVVAALENGSSFQAAVALIETSDVAARRSRLESLRIHDDDWFFERFGLSW